MDFNTALVPPDLFPESFPPTDMDTMSITGMYSLGSTVIIPNIVHFGPVVDAQDTTVWQTPGISGISRSYALSK